jgi:nicotinate-nucleotide--dimethylbenzimidazole phosphoribosyltransferase
VPETDRLTQLNDLVASIPAPDSSAVTAARDLQSRLAKPPGSLGALEELSVRLAGLAGQCPPPMLEPAAVAVFAGDHGVCARGVSVWPTDVTVQMIGNFLAGGAVVNAFARQANASVTIVDVGVAAELPPSDGLFSRKVRAGTRDFVAEPAMTTAEVLEAIFVGVEVADTLIDSGARVLVTGDMGIGNTTASAALIAAFTGNTAATVTGRGGGADDEMLTRKTQVIQAGLDLHAATIATDPVGTLAALGGLEHAGLVGFMLRSASRRVPVVLDGVIAVSAAVAAVAIAQNAATAMIAGHRSAEPAATIALDHLGLTALVDLGLRLGEGTGALLALPIAAAAVRVLHEVATFDSAGVSTSTLSTSEPKK